jgi:site-specific recombinase XerD
MHSSHMLREGARPEVVRDILGHANIDVTQNVYGKSWWEERVDTVTQAVEAVSRVFRWIRGDVGFRVFRWPW